MNQEKLKSISVEDKDGHPLMIINGLDHRDNYLTEMDVKGVVGDIRIKFEYTGKEQKIVESFVTTKFSK